jgi:hypothetical protein
MERVCKKAVVAYFKFLSQNFLGGTEEVHRNFNHEIRKIDFVHTKQGC